MMINDGVLSSLMRGNGGEVSALSSSSGSRSNKNSNSTGNGMESIVKGGMSSQPLASSANRASVPTPKKRGHPGSPDADTEVIALSPKSLMAKNRFLCEICNKGFQRDQNLQLHRRGHNLPWKLKQRSSKDAVKKKVYVCPETTCAHHDPSRALGDLTGIKKHFSRKHGEKKWKCEKCTKRYAVQSDWKAHSKICGTREYKCDCGTVFSRRDSFTTHRAFCDALSHENSSRSTLFLRKIPLNTSTDSLQHISSSSCNWQPHGFSIKTEQENFQDLFIPTQQEILVSSTTNLDPFFIQQTNPKTTFFQRAVQMGATMSKPLPFSLNPLMVSQHHQTGFESGETIDSAGMFSSSCGKDRLASVAGGSSFFSHSGFEAFESEALASDHAATCDYRTRLVIDQGAKSTGIESPMPHNSHVDHNRIMMMHHPRNNVDVPSTQQADQLYEYFFNNIESSMINGMINSEVNNHREGDFQNQEVEADPRMLNRRCDDQGTTRDFLGLKASSSVNEGPVKVAGFDFVISSSTSTTNYESRTNNKLDDDEELH